MNGELGILNVGDVSRPGPSDLVIRHAPKFDLTDRTFGRLNVLVYLGFSKSSWRSYWRCLCACGRVVDVRGSAMTRPNQPTLSCGCLAAERASSRQWQGCGLLSRHYWNHIKHHAAERSVAFDLSIEDAWVLFEKQNGRCALSGLEIVFGRYRPKTRAHGLHPRLGTASIDRKNSDGDYVIGNVQWVHKDINRMKGPLPDSAFIELCRLVANQHPPYRPEAGL